MELHFTIYGNCMISIFGHPGNPRKQESPFKQHFSFKVSEKRNYTLKVFDFFKSVYPRLEKPSGNSEK